MRYWDASALVALCVAEGNSPAVRPLTREGIVTWGVSAVEIASATERRAREGSLSDAERAAARAALAELAAWLHTWPIPRGYSTAVVMS